MRPVRVGTWLKGRPARGSTGLEHAVEDVHGAHLAVQAVGGRARAALACVHSRRQTARVQRLGHLPRARS